MKLVIYICWINSHKVMVNIHIRNNVAFITEMNFILLGGLRVTNPTIRLGGLRVTNPTIRLVCPSVRLSVRLSVCYTMDVSQECLG